ncbi:MAG: orotidine-5'-phosphate decarboxylase [Verrucomicrobiae bacterium]|nr:orotidine-5'-phosphate decarboxylase [Verrucomicrobiae bacterium]MCP5540132.1 orotidine-5'-phosphate decarboxylase [Akkermansiaceae bacterium]
MSYRQKLQRRVEARGSRLCVGIDPRPARHPGGIDEIREVLIQLIDETAPHAAAFKPNIAYFEAMGVPGYKLVEEMIGHIWAKGVPVILDAKRGDIGTTQEQYARAYFENWNVDAVTLSPYMGYDSVEPFLGYPEKGVYLLGVTSNAGAADLELKTLAGRGGRAVFELVGDMAAREPEQIGLVVGLTNVSPDLLSRVPDVPLLIPGLGAQGGDLEALAGEKRDAPNVINVSRGILYDEPAKSFAEKARHYANRIADVLG